MLEIKHLGSSFAFKATDTKTFQTHHKAWPECYPNSVHVACVTHISLLA